MASYFLYIMQLSDLKSTAQYCNYANILSFASIRWTGRSCATNFLKASMPPFDATLRFHPSMPPSMPRRCHPSMPLFDATLWCHLSMPPLDATFRCHSSMPLRCHPLMPPFNVNDSMLTLTCRHLYIFSLSEINGSEISDDEFRGTNPQICWNDML